MTFFSFDVDTAMLQTAFWQKLFLDVVKKELLGIILLTVDCSLGRYSPDEPKQITIKADTINLRGETFSLCPGDSSGLSLAVCVYNREGTLVWEHTGYLSLPCEVAFPLELSASSLPGNSHRKAWRHYTYPEGNRFSGSVGIRASGPAAPFSSHVHRRERLDRLLSGGWKDCPGS